MDALLCQGCCLKMSWCRTTFESIDRQNHVFGIALKQRRFDTWSILKIPVITWITTQLGEQGKKQLRYHSSAPLPHCLMIMACMTSMVRHAMPTCAGTETHSSLRRSLDERTMFHLSLLPVCRPALSVPNMRRMAAEVGFGNATLASAIRLGKCYGSEVFRCLCWHIGLRH